MMIFLAEQWEVPIKLLFFFSIKIPNRSHERTAEEKKRKAKAERKNKRKKKGNGKREYSAINSISSRR